MHITLSYPLGPISLARYLHSWNGVGAEKVAVVNISSGAFRRRRVVRYWHPLGRRAIELGKPPQGGVMYTVVVYRMYPSFGTAVLSATRASHARPTQPPAGSPAEERAPTPNSASGMRGKLIRRRSLVHVEACATLHRANPHFRIFRAFFVERIKRNVFPNFALLRLRQAHNKHTVHHLCYLVPPSTMAEPVLFCV